MSNQNPLPWSDQGLILRLQHVIDTRDAILDCSSAMLQRGDNTKRCVYLWGEQFMKYLNEGRVERDLALLHVVNDILFCPSSGYRWVEDFGPVLCEVMPMAIHCAKRKGEAEICRKIQRLPRIWLERQALTVDVAQELIKRCNLAVEQEPSQSRRDPPASHSGLANQDNASSFTASHQQPNALPAPALNPKDIDESIMFAHHIKKCVLEKKLQIFEDNNLEEQNRLRQWQETQLRMAKNQYEMLVMHEQHKQQMAELKSKHESRAAELRVAWVQELQQWRNTVETFDKILRNDPPDPEWLADLLQNCRAAQQCDKTAEDMERLISQIVEDKQHHLDIKPPAESLNATRADHEASNSPLQRPPQSLPARQQTVNPPAIHTEPAARWMPPSAQVAPPVDQVNRNRTYNNQLPTRSVEDKQIRNNIVTCRVFQCSRCPSVFFVTGAIKTFYPDRIYHHYENGQEAKSALEDHMKEVHSPEKERSKDHGNSRETGATRKPRDDVIVVKKEPKEPVNASQPSDEKDFYPFNANKRMESENYVLKNGPRGYGYYKIVEQHVKAHHNHEEITKTRGGDEGESTSRSSTSTLASKSNAGGTIAQIIQQRMKRKQEEERAKKEKDEAEQRLRMEREEEMRRRDIEEMKLRAELQRMKEQLIVERAKLKSEREKVSEESQREVNAAEPQQSSNSTTPHRDPVDHAPSNTQGANGRTASEEKRVEAQQGVSQPEKGEINGDGQGRRHLQVSRGRVKDPRQEVRDPRQMAKGQTGNTSNETSPSLVPGNEDACNGVQNHVRDTERASQRSVGKSEQPSNSSDVSDIASVVPKDFLGHVEEKSRKVEDPDETTQEDGEILDRSTAAACNEGAGAGAGGEGRGEGLVLDLMKRVGCDEETARAALCAATDDVAAAEELIVESRKMEEQFLTQQHKGPRPKLRSSVQGRGHASSRAGGSHKEPDENTKEEATSCVSSEYSSESEREEGRDEGSKERVKETLEGELQLPLCYSNLKVIALGQLPLNPAGYYQGNIVTPVGYEAHRLYYDVADSNEQTEYCCVIREGPRFQLYKMNDKMVSFSGSNPDDPWRQLVVELNKKFDLGLNDRLCGFTMFGLKHLKVAEMIKSLSGYENYVKFLLKGNKPSRGDRVRKKDKKKEKRKGKKQEVKVSLDDFSRQEVRAGQALLELFDYYSMAQEQLDTVDSSTEVARKLVEQEIRTSNAPRLEVGMRVRAKWKARRGLQGWYQGTIVKIANDGKVDVDYDDGDFEHGVLPIHVKILKNAKKRKGGGSENETLQPSKSTGEEKTVKKAKTRDQELSKIKSEQDKEIIQLDRLQGIRTCQLILKDLMQKECAAPFLYPDQKLLRSLIGSFGMSVELARSKSLTDITTINKKIDQTLNSTRRAYKNPSQIREDFIRVLRYFCLFYGEASAIAKQATELLGEFQRCYFSQIGVLDHLGVKVFEHGEHWLGQRLRRFFEEEKIWRECVIDDYDGKSSYHVLFCKEETEDWIVLPSFDVQLIPPKFQSPAELLPIRAGNHVLCEDKAGGHEGIFFHAEVEEYNAEEGRALVHFNSWPRRFDQWIDMETSRVFLVDADCHSQYANGRVMCTDEDTPRSISKSFGVDVDKLLLVNKMDYPEIQKASRFKRGAMLLLPMQPFVFERMQEARNEAGEQESRSSSPQLLDVILEHHGDMFAQDMQPRNRRPLDWSYGEVALMRGASPELLGSTVGVNCVDARYLGVVMAYNGDSGEYMIQIDGSADNGGIGDCMMGASMVVVLPNPDVIVLQTLSKTSLEEAEKELEARAEDASLEEEAAAANGMEAMENKVEEIVEDAARTRQAEDIAVGQKLKRQYDGVIGTVTTRVPGSDIVLIEWEDGDCEDIHISDMERLCIHLESDN